MNEHCKDCYSHANMLIENFCELYGEQVTEKTVERCKRQGEKNNQ